MNIRSLLRGVALAGVFLPAGTAAQGVQKIEVCHTPPGNPANTRTLSIPDAALDAHLAHGDWVGSCAPTAERAGRPGKRGGGGNNGGGENSGGGGNSGAATGNRGGGGRGQHGGNQPQSEQTGGGRNQRAGGGENRRTPQASGGVPSRGGAAGGLDRPTPHANTGARAPQVSGGDSARGGNGGGANSGGGRGDRRTPSQTDNGARNDSDEARTPPFAAMAVPFRTCAATSPRSRASRPARLPRQPRAANNRRAINHRPAAAIAAPAIRTRQVAAAGAVRRKRAGAERRNSAAIE